MDYQLETDLTEGERLFYPLMEHGVKALAKTVALRRPEDPYGKAYAASDLARRTGQAASYEGEVADVTAQMAALQAAHAELPRDFDTATLQALRTRCGSLKITRQRLAAKRATPSLFGALVADVLDVQIAELDDALEGVIGKIRQIEAPFEGTDVRG